MYLSACFAVKDAFWLKDEPATSADMDTYNGSNMKVDTDMDTYNGSTTSTTKPADRGPGRQRIFSNFSDFGSPVNKP